MIDRPPSGGLASVPLVGSLAILPVVAASAHGLSAGLPLESLQNRPILLLVGLAALSLLPFAFVTLTSFLKISVVLSLVRTAIGTPQVPSNMIVTGLSAVLSLVVMAPVGAAMWTTVAPAAESFSNANEGSAKSGTTGVLELWNAGRAAAEPLREFLERNAHEKDRALFLELARQRRAPDAVHEGDFLIVLPAFITSQLKDAFEIGFLLFLPFLLIDLVVSNILLALGMHMLSPTTISLPFKLLLFVLVDGWLLLARGLMLGYR